MPLQKTKNKKTHAKCYAIWDLLHWRFSCTHFLFLPGPFVCFARTTRRTHSFQTVSVQLTAVSFVLIVCEHYSHASWRINCGNLDKNRNRRGKEVHETREKDWSSKANSLLCLKNLCGYFITSALWPDKVDGNWPILCWTTITFTEILSLSTALKAQHL